MAGRGLLEFVTTRDYRLMQRVNRWRPPRWVRVWMVCATRLGDGWLWCAVGLAMLVFGGLHTVRALATASAAAGVGITTFLALKGAFQRLRPCAVEAHCWSDLLPPDQFSFPSGHSITAFAMAVCLGLFYPALMPALLFAAVSIAASRVVLGMHFLSDVIAGSLIGAVLGYLAFALM